MSADKHKKKTRAYTYLRNLRRGYEGYPKDVAAADVSGPLTPIMRYCLDRGLATLTRVTRYGHLRRRNNKFSAE